MNKDKTILITGGTGLTGRRLTAFALERGYQVIVLTQRNTFPKSESPNLRYAYWNVKNGIIDDQAILDADVIIHLAGAGVADKRWTKNYKKLILTSRVNATKTLAEAITRLNNPPSVFVSSSAIGFYGSDGGDAIFTEFSEAGTGFLSNVCIEWEKQALQANEFTRVVIGRIGIVLDPREGALAKMLLPFSMFMGGKIGSGNQWMSWIHPIDIIGFILHAMSNEHVRGTFNLVAPGAVTMNRFTELLSSILHRPSWLHVPDIALSILLGEGAVIATGGQHVLPQRTIESGYRFQYTDCDHTLRDLLG